MRLYTVYTRPWATDGDYLLVKEGFLLASGCLYSSVGAMEAHVARGAGDL